jgi:pyruvate kinase
VEGGFRSLAGPEPAQAKPLGLRQAVARSAAQLARELRVRAVVVRTLEGVTASVVAGTRPSAPVVAMTLDPATCRRLNLVWGVVPRLIDAHDFERPEAAARRLARELGLAREGEFILLLAGFGRREPTVTALPV